MSQRVTRLVKKPTCPRLDTHTPSHTPSDVSGVRWGRLQRDGTIQQKAVVVEDESSSPEREDAPAAPRRAKPAAAAAPAVADDTTPTGGGLGMVTKTPQGELSALYQAVVTDVVASIKVRICSPLRGGRGERRGRSRGQTLEISRAR